ncbi:MAG TPA: DUF4386 domain-containing protein [Acidimicrobiia bacterium]|nr:DUF4386 domain-containing protein [Acidimicrobiia bacterium]
MNIERAAGAFLIILPLAFNLFFFLLSRRFDYPNILRSPTEDILSRFHAGGVGLKVLWYGFMLTAALVAPLAVLLGQVLAQDDLAIVPAATVVGVIAGVVQLLGLARWPFLVPTLARTHADPDATEAQREATKVVFDSFHRYLGVGIGECLGYLLTGTWSLLVGVGMLQSSAFGAWIGWLGIIIGVLLVVGSLEFVGRFEEQGWRLAGTIVPITYIAWSLWLILTGFVLLVG